MPIVSLVAPFHLLGQYYQNEMQYGFFVYVISLVPASASFGANGIINGPLHLFSQDNENEVQYYFFGHVMHLVLQLASFDADGIVNGIPSFVS